MKKLFFVFVLSLLYACQSEVTSHDLIIENVKVIDVKTGVIETKTLCIDKGRISNILKPEKTKSYKSEIILDGTDKYLLPGFWDNHVHFRGGDSLIEANKDFLKLFIMNGITTVRDAGGDLTTSVMEWKHQIDSNQLIGPTIFTAGPKIDGKNATWAGSIVVENEEDIDVALDSLESLNVDFVKLYDSRIDGELFLKTIKNARERNLITSGHMPFTVTLDETLESGIGAIEHLYYILKGCSSDEGEITEAILNKEYGFWESMEKLVATYSDSVALQTFSSLKSHDAFVVPTLHIGDVLSYLDEVNHDNDIYLNLMPEGLIKTYEGRINRSLNSTEKAREDRKSLNSFFKELAKSLSDNDVKLLAGSDSGAFNSYTYPGISLHKELEAMSKAGISNLKALQASAYNGSDYLNKESDYGVIEVGKISDLVILNKNPLEDINNTRTINFVIKGNDVYNPEILALALECPECVLK